MTLDKAVKIIYDTLPRLIDLTPRGKFVKRSSYGTRGYMDNYELTMNIVIHDKGVISINYYVDFDETYFLEDNKGDIIEFRKMTETELINKLTSMFSHSFGDVKKFR